MRVALCQIPVSSTPAVNAGRVTEALASAAAQGADLAVFPEATQLRFGSDLSAAAEPLDGPFCSGLGAAAKETGVALVAGGVEPAPGGRGVQHRGGLRRRRGAGRRLPEAALVRRVRRP